jgi:hypothetical protein
VSKIVSADGLLVTTKELSRLAAGSTRGDKMATAKENAIVRNIEKKLGPVGKGHHNSHRTEALLRWLKKHEAENKKG